MIEVTSLNLGDTNNADNVISIKPTGSIELDCAEELERTINSALNSSCHRIIIDLSLVNHIGSCGWGVMLSKLKKVRENGGDLKIVGMHAEVYDFYKALEFFWVLRAYSTIEEAVDDFMKNIAPMPEC